MCHSRRLALTIQSNILHLLVDLNDISCLQIDTNYLAALPDDIKAEIMQNGLRKRKRKANKSTAFGPKNLNPTETYIIVEGIFSFK